MSSVTAELTKLMGIEGSRLLKFLAPHFEKIDARTQILKTTEVFNLSQHVNGTLDNVVNLHRVNDIRGINNFFRVANQKLKYGGTFVGCVETLEQRKSRLFSKYPFLINHLYYALDFMFKRVFPKFKITRKFYFFLTNGRNQAMSKSEVLGRLVYCGFEIRDIEESNNKLYFKVEKAKKPFGEPEPSTGLILRINRIGRNGKPITVYKFRTMHPYAQYIQSYVFEQNNLQEGGKFRDDFRITKWGRWMRRFWIDEIPMIYNILRGDLKLIGVRPLSEHYLSLYTPEHKLMRVNGKPGLIPPFYADMPRNLEEIMESESRYIMAYKNDPYTTDWNYCMKAFANIFLHNARSH